MNSIDFSAMSSDVLTQRLDDLVRTERGCIVDCLLHLAEIDRRNIHLGLGFSSLFDYCSRHLRLSNGASFRRSQATRLVSRFPLVAEYLRDGRVSLKKLVALRECLDDTNCRELLERASASTEKEVEVIAASFKPSPEPRESIREVKPRQVPMPQSKVASTSPGEVNPPAPPPAMVTMPPPPARVEPVSESRFSIHVTVSAEFHRELK